MTTYKPFSNRNRPRPQNLVYDELPDVLRAHCLGVIRRAIGKDEVALDHIDEELQREHPKPTFVRAPILSLDGRPPRYMERFFEDCITQGDFFEAMDAIELAARAINDGLRKLPRHKSAPMGGPHAADEARDEMNSRFVERGVGYQFSKEQGLLVRVDSEFMHQEVTQPSMALLTEKGFEGAAQEFETAHRHYRQAALVPDAGKDAVAWAVKAVESTAKTILDAHAWPYDAQKDTLVPLLEKLFTNGLVPTELQGYFGGLRSALKCGLPTIGNRQARHGQGAMPKPIEAHMVTLAMHLAAATIRFLVEAHKAK